MKNPRTYIPSSVLVRAKELLNVSPASWIKWSGSDGHGGYCAYGATMHARTEQRINVPALSFRGNILDQAAVEVANEIGKPLVVDGQDMRGDRKGRRDAAYFNNTSESIVEINLMFCRAIEKALDAEEEEEHGSSE